MYSEAFYRPIILLIYGSSVSDFTDSGTFVTFVLVDDFSVR